MLDRKKTLKRIKKYGKVEFNQNEYLKKQYINQNGEAVIRVKVKEMKDIFSTYSCRDSEILNFDIAEYIEDCAYNIPITIPIKVKFEIEDKEKFIDAYIIERVYKEYFGMITQDKEDDIKLNYYKMIRLTVVGILILLILYLTTKYVVNTIFYELMSIAGTFALWEAVNCLIVEKRSLKVNKINAGQLAIAKVEII